MAFFLFALLGFGTGTGYTPSVVVRGGAANEDLEPAKHVPGALGAKEKRKRTTQKVK